MIRAKHLDVSFYQVEEISLTSKCFALTKKMRDGGKTLANHHEGVQAVVRLRTNSSRHINKIPNPIHEISRLFNLKSQIKNQKPSIYNPLTLLHSFLIPLASLSWT